MIKLNSFLLIDDSKSTNVFNTIIIRRMGCVEEIHIAENGKEALDILKSGLVPEIIFLDINMPIMNGWEFLAEYKKLDETFKTSVIVLMTGTKLGPEEEKKLKTISEIKEYSEKMLTAKVVQEIVYKYFGNMVNASAS